MTEPEDPGPAGDHLVEIADEQSRAIDLSLIQRVASHALTCLDMRGELSLALVTPERIAELKGQYYGEHASTDVLSFSMDGPKGPVIGDVIVCPDVAARQARALGRPLMDEIVQLVVHGIIHLCGRDHATPRDEIAMAADERHILRTA
ncbi:MAG: rRNA maturation RNase YbeY [Actinomycetota bacterium]